MFLLQVFIIFITFSCSLSTIEQVDDTDLVHLLTGGEDVITLFTKTNCPECDNLESVVRSVQKDLQDSLGAVVVKAQNSHLVGLYNPLKEPALIYFRKGIPLLYHGQIEGNEIIQTFNDNREPIVKELSDENFEHLTQASTGATTGDWFLFFYSADCVLCQRLYAVWEAVGAKLRRRLNVARINSLDRGISTAKRFKISESPEFIFLRQGKFFRYKSKDYSPKSLIDFANGGYLKHLNGETVPALPSAMNEMLLEYYRVFTDNLQYRWIGLIIVLISLILIFIFKCLIKSTKKVKTIEKKSK